MSKYVFSILRDHHWEYVATFDRWKDTTWENMRLMLILQYYDVPVGVLRVQNPWTHTMDYVKEVNRYARV